MIRNIIFDMVGVVIRFDTEKYYNDHKIRVPDRELLKREVFGSLEWARQDRGTISDEDVIERISLRVPERLHYAVRDFARRENRDILLVEGIEDLLADLKMAGYKVFLLSNTSGGFHRFWPKVGVDKWFEDTMISADEGLVKPDLAFFRLACDRLRIRPEESVFIDDTPMNVEAAEYVGMSGFLFHGDIRELRDWLEETGAALQGGEPINRKNVDTAMTIRVMTVSDYDKVYDLWMSCRNMGFNNLDDSREGIDKYLRRNPSTCFIAEDGDAVIGVILAGHDGRRGFIHHMAVAENFRRKGIGTDLLSHALAALKEEGINKVALLVFNRNEAGNAFWESQGFTVRDDVTYRNRALTEMVRIDT